MRCINIDWLSVFGIFNREIDIMQAFTGTDIQVIDNQRGTRQFNRWVTLTLKGLHLAQICYDPFSLKREGGIYLDNACTIQIANRFCYDIRLFNLLSDIADKIEFRLQSVSRVDICYDFFVFDNQMKPKTLILGFFTGAYLKVGYSKALTVGEQFNDYHPQTISFRGKNSAISTKLYNKSQEMRDKKVKNYICDAWQSCGLVGKDVWRLELSIKSDGRDIVHIETGELVKIGIRELSDRENLLTIFLSIIKHKFRWLYAEPGKRRDKLKPVELFTLKKNESIYKPVKVTVSRDYGKRAKMIMNAINEMLEDTTINQDMRKRIRQAQFDLVQYYRAPLSMPGEIDKL